MAAAACPAEAVTVDDKRRLPAPKPSRMPAIQNDELLVEQLLKGQITNWSRAKSAVKRIRDPEYHCGLFFEDCIAAFPELTLYVVDATGAMGTSSGRSLDDEFQRTMGALFTVYWLMRLDGDGAQSFVFGVASKDWQVLSVDATEPRRLPAERTARQAFLENFDWNLFQEVLVSSGMICPDRTSYNEERVLAMLVLGAVHDIMKIRALVPVVAPKHVEFYGYKAGEQIIDHDVALGYVLEHHPEALPSFAGLPPRQRESLKFTQCKMEYNMGWLVQGEAPPGALFRSFKAMITAGHARPQDVALYFVHWLTDLAGAEPFPLEGCEKFVLKFPRKILTAFLNSFSVVQHLSSKSETEVFEEYLEWRWTSCENSDLGQLPAGPGSVAKMRIAVMAQANQASFVEAISKLSPADKEMLESEFARTGCRDQVYRRDPLESKHPESGPAFLVYYGPALLQKNSDDPVGALQVLAEVLRQARAHWPLQIDAGDETVTVRIDALKELTVSDIQRPHSRELWTLQKLGGRDAQVVRFDAASSGGMPSVIDRDIHKFLSLATHIEGLAQTGAQSGHAMDEGGAVE